jgi:hypothetical protein
MPMHSVRLAISLSWVGSTFTSGQLQALVPVLISRDTKFKTGFLTGLFSIASTLLYFAVDKLGMEELRQWIEFVEGRSTTYQ